tara:strand:- start:1054 stop:1206 length:153 start_codon:yes stop_codon:yes gene_type:complete
MKPIDVVKQLVKDNPNNMQLGELVRQYILELNESTKWDIPLKVVKRKEFK